MVILSVPSATSRANIIIDNKQVHGVFRAKMPPSLYYDCIQERGEVKRITVTNHENIFYTVCTSLETYIIILKHACPSTIGNGVYNNNIL